MLFDTLVETYNKLESTTKRLEMTDILADLFKIADSGNIDKIIYMTQGKIHPDWKGEPEIGMAEKMVKETLIRVTGLKKAKATPWWSLPRKLRVNTPAAPTTAFAEESAFTATAISGGLKDVCVTQLTVAASTSSPWPLLVVSTYIP